MQTLARACVPDAPCNMPQETEAVVERLIRHLVPLLDAGSQMDSLDAAGPADMALVRLTSSEALLRLARLHDSRIYPEVYMALALTMQVCTDPCPVNAAFICTNTYHCYRLLLLPCCEAHLHDWAEGQRQ